MSEQPTAKPRKPAPTIADFPHRISDNIRWADLDAQGHVNNAVIATYFESGRVVMLRQRDLGIGVPNATFVMVRQEIDYLAELRWPGTVDIGTALDVLGRSSFTVRHGLFHGDVCTAVGRATCVMLDATTRRPRPLPPEIIAMLEQWRPAGA